MILDSDQKMHVVALLGSSSAGGRDRRLLFVPAF